MRRQDNDIGHAISDQIAPVQFNRDSVESWNSRINTRLHTLIANQGTTHHNPLHFSSESFPGLPSSFKSRFNMGQLSQEERELPRTFGLWSGISVGWLTVNSFGGLSFILFVSLSAGGLPTLVYG